LESWIEATALSIRDKEVQRKSDNRTFTIYTIKTDHGEMTTSKRELAEHAFQYLNVPARYLVNVQQNGNFTNTYLQDIAPIPGTATPARPALGAQQEAPPPQASPPPDIVRGETTEAPVSLTVNAEVQWSAKDMAIYRQVAAKVSAVISRTPEEFFANCDIILAYIVDGSKP
jgi:hypothetical protein